MKAKRTHEYHAVIREALCQEWDPLGVGDDCAGEYDGYAPGILKLLIAGKSKVQLADHFWRLETHEMGITADRRRIERFVDHLLEMFPELGS